MIHLKDEKFEDIIKEGKVVVDFAASWCGPCQMLGPILEDFAKDHEDIKVVKVDIDEHEELARSFGIMSVPTLLLYEDGKKIKTQIGFLPKEELENWALN